MDARRYPFWRYALAALPVVALVLALNWVSLTVVPEHAAEMAVMEDGLNRLAAGEAGAVNLGPSVGEALDFAEMGLPGVNLAYPVRDLLESEALLDIILARAIPLQRVFLAAGPMSLLTDNAWLSPHARRQFYRIVAPERGWRPIGGDWSNLVQGRLLPLVRHDRWRRPLAVARARLAGEPVDPSILGEVRTLSHTRLDEAAVMKEALAIERWRTADVERGDYYQHGTAARMRDALMRICRTAAAHRVGLVIYTPPLTDLYRRENRAYYRKAQPYWDRAMSSCTHDGATVLRWDEDADFSRAYGLFSDLMHLNAEGAAVFSRAMGRRLGLRGDHAGR